MPFKLQPGPSILCETCSYGVVMKHPDNDVSVHCTRLTPSILLDKLVVECNTYSSKENTSLWEMRQLAWNVKVSSSGRTIGFEAPAKPDDD